MSLSKDAILKADDLPRELVQVPEWGGTVWVRTMTGAERDAFEASVAASADTPNLTNIRARLAVLCVVDDKGKRLFADADAEALGGKSAAALSRVFEAGQKLNGLTDSDVSDLEKN